MDGGAEVLCEVAADHVKEEETTGFSYDFEKDELEAMAQQFQSRKAQLITKVA